MLTDRQEIILFYIVDDFLNAMNPVSSKYLIDKYHLDISSATVRNDMAKLESEGYLTKPHTSAGRMPSRSALRYYIDTLSSTLDGAAKEPFELASLSHHDPFELTRQMAAEVSGATKHLTQVSLLGKDERVKGIYLTPISDNLLVVVIVLSSGNIEKLPVGMSDEVTIHELGTISNMLNPLVYDIPLTQVSALIEIRHQKDHISDLLKSITRELSVLASPSHFSGHSGFNHLIHQIGPDTDTLQLLYDDIESDQLGTIIDLDHIEGVDVYLSDELDREYESISVITTNFKYFDLRGNLMIIGPEIMGYKQVIKLLYSIKNHNTKGSD